MRHDSPHIQELNKNKHFDWFTLVSDKDGRVTSSSSRRKDSSYEPPEAQLDDPQASPQAELPEVQRRHRREDQGGHQRPGELHALPARGR